MIDSLRSTAALTVGTRYKIQSGGVDSGQVDVLGHLQRVVHFFGQFRDFGDHRVKRRARSAKRRAPGSGQRRRVASTKVVHARQLGIQQLVVVAHLQQLRVRDLQHVDDVGIAARFDR